MASIVYNEYKAKMTSINWADNTGVTIKGMLVDNTYVENQDTHLNISDINDLGVEVTGINYTVGGLELVNRAVSVDNVNDWGIMTADNLVWTSATISARGLVVYVDTGVVSTSTLINYVDFGSDKEVIVGDFLIQWSSDGIFRVS